jgi:hypothetical protein
MVLGLLHCLWLSAPRADGNCAADHPLGAGRIERYAAPFGPLLEMRSQGRNPYGFQLGLHDGRLPTIPGRRKRKAPRRQRTTKRNKAIDNLALSRREVIAGRLHCEEEHAPITSESPVRATGASP